MSTITNRSQTHLRRRNAVLLTIRAMLFHRGRRRILECAAHTAHDSVHRQPFVSLSDRTEFSRTQSQTQVWLQTSHGNAGVWKAWKAIKPAFHPSHTPWKSLRGFPHYHGYGDDYHVSEDRQSPPKTRNQSHSHRKGLVNHVPGLKRKGCPGTLITRYEGLAGDPDEKHGWRESRRRIERPGRARRELWQRPEGPTF